MKKSFDEIQAAITTPDPEKKVINLTTDIMKQRINSVIRWNQEGYSLAEIEQMSPLSKKQILAIISEITV